MLSSHDLGDVAIRNRGCCRDKGGHQVRATNTP